MQIQVKIVKNTVDLESLFSSQFKAEQGMWVREKYEETWPMACPFNMWIPDVSYFIKVLFYL